ncbi:bifunctional adenosylcobinamide kinase/adenosylcobinamide-phosphate guanylyltransferase [Pararhodospirillum oryzae]|uniref:Bifunctional adenosylcobalamin biosynthesis protein n=1 Tax=Pararhodospirillum oryzae TaxID=478448 RepID=A0A512H6U3_9PROT|nr:bifunctional adenosylcobinamide kinase/adenosylcobinamide-phosphate guanylyltransferase [Pararhodospirillum oryzae]GEO81177.1 adenosylcobinamide kinase/adenosylcobinamide phosphate guanyltransferase [Pararhodospirillum oryzae]
MSLGVAFDPDRPAPAPSLTLVLGGARSGKSTLAERLTLASGPRPLYFATARPVHVDGDPEMIARVKAHQDRRGPAWTTIEAGADLAGALATHATDPTRPVLIDCLILWLGGLMMATAEPDGAVPQSPEAAALAAGRAGAAVGPALDALEAALARVPAPVIVVSGEVGLGLVPMEPLSRQFRDALGLINQRLAARAQRAVLCVAGLPLVLKDTV